MDRKFSGIPLYIYFIVISMLICVTFLSSRAVTVLSENAPVTTRKCIIIDAGHGGVDGGATSCTGVLESNINLEISLKLNDLFHLLGVQTVMIRATDCSVYTEGSTIAEKKISDLKERVRIVNETDDGILVSIHQNYFSESKYNGAQVFYSENAVSKNLAEKIQTELINSINLRSNRSSKRAEGIYLMEHITRPGVLIECGFLSNPTEEAKLRSHAYQCNLCCVIASVCSQFLQQDLPLA